jgi:hypothetical protein
MPAPGVSVAVEVWTREEPWLEAFRRMVEHLECGVTIVLFLSERHRSIYVYRDDVGPCRFEPDAALQVPDVLPGFSVPVAALFA